MPISRNDNFIVLTNDGDGSDISLKVNRMFKQLENALELRELAPPERQIEADVFGSIELAKFLAGLAHASAEYALKAKHYRAWKALGAAAQAAEDGVAGAEATEVWKAFQKDLEGMEGTEVLGIIK